MDSSCGEKREVNPPTVYRPEAVYSSAIHNPAVDCIQQWVHWKPKSSWFINIQLQHLAEYNEADGGTESRVSLKVKILMNMMSLSRYCSLYGHVWQFTNLLFHWLISLTGRAAITLLVLSVPAAKDNPFLPTKYFQFHLPLVYSLLSAKKYLDWCP